MATVFFKRKRLISYLLALLILQVATGLSGRSLVQTNYIDFRTFYTAGSMVRTGNGASLYDYDVEQRMQSELVSPEDRALPMMSPPYAALLFVPLSFFSFQTAYLLFLAANLAFLLLAAFLLTPSMAALRDRWRPAPLVLCLSFLPAGIALLMGQLSLLLLLLYCLCHVALQRGRPFLAGFFLALALLKFQIALPIAFLFLCWRQWRFLSGFLTGATALVAISAAVMGSANPLPYFKSLFAMTNSITTDLASQSHFAILPAQMPNLYGFFFTMSHGSSIAAPLTILVSIAIVAWAATRPASLPLALLTGTLVSYHLFLYDLTILLLPLSITLNSFVLEDTLKAKAKHPSKGKFTQTASAATLLIAPLGRLLIAVDSIYLFCLPILFLAASWYGRDRSSPEHSRVP